MRASNKNLTFGCDLGAGLFKKKTNMLGKDTVLDER